MSAIVRVRDNSGRVYDIPAIRGYSAYQVAVKNGFEGTEEEWLAGIMGVPGYSAYEVAVQEGFEGSAAEWIASLKGPQGEKGDKGDIGDTGPQGETGPKGDKGDTGKSAYQEALERGFNGSEEEWLASLKGPKGDTPGVLTEEWTFTLDSGAVVVKRVVTD